MSAQSWSIFSKARNMTLLELLWLTLYAALIQRSEIVPDLILVWKYSSFWTGTAGRWFSQVTSHSRSCPFWLSASLSEMVASNCGDSTALLVLACFGVPGIYNHAPVITIPVWSLQDRSAFLFFLPSFLSFIFLSFLFGLQAHLKWLWFEICRKHKR